MCVHMEGETGNVQGEGPKVHGEGRHHRVSVCAWVGARKVPVQGEGESRKRVQQHLR